MRPRLLYRRLLHSLDNYGVRGLLCKPALPTPSPAYIPGAPHPFDLAHATDTSGHIPGEALATGSPADLYNTAYYAISPSTLRQALAALPFAPVSSTLADFTLADFTFVDLGCGKGRALLIAAQQGFGRVLGIELSPALAEIARSNASPHANIQIRIADASTIAYPQSPLLVFLYHPFLPPLLRRVLRNLLAQSAARPVYLLFANPPNPSLLNRFSSLVLEWSRDFDLSPEDHAADRHGIYFERYLLFKMARPERIS
jgi:SAM-dependent methyltransferase